MKILFLTSRLPYPPNRGDKLRVFNFLKRLSKNHSITLLSFISSREQMVFAEELGKYCVKVETVLLKPWQSYLSCLLHILSPAPFQVSYYYSRAMRRKVDNISANKHFDAAYIHLFRMAPYAYRVRNITKVLDLCDAVSEHYRGIAKYKKTILWPMYFAEYLKTKRYERILVGDFKKIATISKNDKKYLAALNGHKGNIYVIPNGVDYKHLRPSKLKKKEKKIIFLGYLSTFYNLDGLMYFYKQILPLIKREMPNVIFSVIGAGVHREIEKLAKKGEIELIRNVPDLKPYLAKGSVFVCPLRVGSGAQNKVLEAMAMGLPVVTTSIGQEGIGAVRNKEIFVEDEAKGFARKVLELLSDSSLSANVSKNARNFIENKFNWEDSIRGLEKLLSSN